MHTTQYTVFPLDPRTHEPAVAPELGFKFNVTASDQPTSRKLARLRADQIARAFAWLDRGVREVCVVDAPVDVRT